MYGSTDIHGSKRHFQAFYISGHIFCPVVSETKVQTRLANIGR